METKKSSMDAILYVLLCIASLGGVWLMRVIISQAIRYAFGQTIWNDQHTPARFKRQ